MVQSGGFKARANILSYTSIGQFWDAEFEFRHKKRLGALILPQNVFLEAHFLHPLIRQMLFCYLVRVSPGNYAVALILTLLDITRFAEHIYHIQYKVQNLHDKWLIFSHLRPSYMETI